LTIRTGRAAITGTPDVQGDGELDHRSRAAHRPKVEIDRIDLGNEAPLSVDGGTGMTIDRRRVSAQWFSGTILTGLCGAALMGGAVFTSLDGEAHFAALPERVEATLRGAIAERSSGPRKADRQPPAGEANSARQVIRDTRTSRVGNREVVRVRSFVRVSSNLAMATTELSAGIPPFNPQKMLAESDAPATASTSTASVAEPDAEVSFVQRDLASVLPRAKIAGAVSMEDVLATIREAVNWSTSDPNTRYQVAGLTPATRALGYASEGNPDPYAGFEARIVPENITLLPKNTVASSAANERTLVVKKGDNIASILQELGALPQEVRAIVSALGFRGRDNGLKEGQRVRVLLNTVAGNGRAQPARVIIANDSAIEAVIALSDLGRYVAVDVSAMNTASVAEAREDDEEDDGRGVRLYQSIYETALRNQIPRAVIEDMIRVYSYDVDFQRKVQPGDAFDVLFAGEDESQPNADSRNEVLFASLTISGEQRKFYRFQTPDDSIVDYYDETGKSAKKFLVRKPMSDGILRSGFGVRRHPILGYAKMHTGVDWAAPHGTPIYAAGNGEVEKVGWEGGYGKYIRIKHTNGYETAYGHMTAYARGIEAGAKIRQGQVIGFVGSTGLSTGAHLHYEIMVNGRFVDPMRIRLPRGRVLEHQLLAAFEAERDRLETMMARGNGGRVAQTNASAR
jgi:murein DD-endopeptidase MepM/ murein hydrolase activator NlpD